MYLFHLYLQALSCQYGRHEKSLLGSLGVALSLSKSQSKSVFTLCENAVSDYLSRYLMWSQFTKSLVRVQKQFPLYRDTLFLYVGMQLYSLDLFKTRLITAAHRKKSHLKKAKIKYSLLCSARRTYLPVSCCRSGLWHRAPRAHSYRYKEAHKKGEGGLFFRLLWFFLTGIS